MDHKYIDRTSGEKIDLSSFCFKQYFSDEQVYLKSVRQNEFSINAIVYNPNMSRHLNGSIFRKNQLSSGDRTFIFLYTADLDLNIWK